MLTCDLSGMHTTGTGVAELRPPPQQAPPLQQPRGCALLVALNPNLVSLEAEVLSGGACGAGSCQMLARG